uniref:Uncharacterized protein n=1 Tax=Anopheles farauti TaxID=69004 RepID=A0A182Q6D0_9DIPT
MSLRMFATDLLTFQRRCGSFIIINGGQISIFCPIFGHTKRFSTNALGTSNSLLLSDPGKMTLNVVVVVMVVLVAVYRMMKHKRTARPTSAGPNRPHANFLAPGPGEMVVVGGLRLI